MSGYEPSRFLTEQAKVNAPMCWSYIYFWHQKLTSKTAVRQHYSLLKKKKDVQDAGTNLDGGNLHNLWIFLDVQVPLTLTGKRSME